MKDIHITKSKNHIDIDEVGVTDLLLPISIKEKRGEIQRVAAKIKISVDLSNKQKGVHMSRFLELMNGFGQRIFNEEGVITSLLQNTKQTFQSKNAHVAISFTFFIQKEAPVSKKSSLMGYQCVLGGTINPEDEVSLFTKLFVPVSTVCPCSKEISKQGAHAQRGEVALKVVSDETIRLEDLINIVEEQGSGRVYPLLKRVDEKRVTETMFRNPKFVEDVVRNVSLQLQKDARIKDFHVECTNYESIHQHNVYAKIRKRTQLTAKLQ